MHIHKQTWILSDLWLKKYCSKEAKECKIWKMLSSVKYHFLCKSQSLSSWAQWSSGCIQWSAQKHGLSRVKHKRRRDWTVSYWWCRKWSQCLQLSIYWLLQQASVYSFHSTVTHMTPVTLNETWNKTKNLLIYTCVRNGREERYRGRVITKHHIHA